ncbi:MAG TPA: hypothetical protein DEO84_08300 [candidate division Zixibacteria bacterium]|nr:hypothetical protein [candidate division Zixibacteria bacterium]
MASGTALHISLSFLGMCRWIRAWIPVCCLMGLWNISLLLMAWYAERFLIVTTLALNFFAFGVERMIEPVI